MKIPGTFLLLLFLAFSLTRSEAETVPYENDKLIQASQWEVLNISFSTETPNENPVDLPFTAILSTEGQELEIEGFFDGDNTYLIRFTPPVPGEWTFITKSADRTLAGKTGRIEVAEASPDRRGGIIVDPENTRKFCYENGENYYPIAYEVDWLFALDANNPTDIPKTRTFASQVAANGFNQIILNVFAYDVTWTKDPNLPPEFDYGSPDLFPFAGSNESPDHSKLNVEYFQRLDRVIEELDRNGIVAHLMIYVWNKRVAWPEADSEQDNRYFDYVAKRYQAYPNLIWDISKEALGYGRTDVHYITERIERLRGLDSYNRLITVHDYSYCRRFTGNVDFVSVQLWGTELYSIMRKVIEDMPGKPIVNIEHGGYEKSPYVVFEGNYTSPEVCLARSYQCVFAGTFPSHYWQGAAWNVIIPDIMSLPPEQRPRLDFYRHMKTLIDTYSVDSLIAGDKKSASGFCLHDDDKFFLFYVPSENSHMDLRLREFEGETMTLTWFDPFTGEFTEPVRELVQKWPRVKVPSKAGFKVLAVAIE